MRKLEPKPLVRRADGLSPIQSVEDSRERHVLHFDFADSSRGGTRPRRRRSSAAALASRRFVLLSLSALSNSIQEKSALASLSAPKGELLLQVEFLRTLCPRGVSQKFC